MIGKEQKKILYRDNTLAYQIILEVILFFSWKKSSL